MLPMPQQLSCHGIRKILERFDDLGWNHIETNHPSNFNYKWKFIHKSGPLCQTDTKPLSKVMMDDTSDDLRCHQIKVELKNTHVHCDLCIVTHHTLPSHNIISQGGTQDKDWTQFNLLYSSCTHWGKGHWNIFVNLPNDGGVSNTSIVVKHVQITQKNEQFQPGCKNHQ